MKKMFMCYWVALALTSCAQKKKEEPAPVFPKLVTDTLRLTMPKEEITESTVPVKDYVEITGKGFDVEMQGKKYHFPGSDALEQFFVQNRQSADSLTFSIFISNTATSKQVVDALDIFKKTGIRKYSILPKTVLTPAEASKAPVITIAEAPQPDIDDPAAFVINVAGNAYEVSLEKEKHTYDNIREVDDFISAQRSKIDPAKVILSAGPNASYQQTSKVIDLMKKYAFYKFKMYTAKKP